MTKVIGLTGSIGMGKSTVARQFRQHGAWVSDADAIVHRLMAPGGKAFEAIAQRFPEVIQDGTIDRKALGRIVFSNDQALRWLEQLLHPLVRQEHLAIIQQARYRRQHTVVLEIPLLFETGADTLCDIVCVVTCPAFLQRQRVLRRPGMTDERLQQVLAKQLPDWEKRQRADAIIQTGLGKRESLRTVRRIMRHL